MFFFVALKCTDPGTARFVSLHAGSARRLFYIPRVLGAGARRSPHANLTTSPFGDRISLLDRVVRPVAANGAFFASGDGVRSGTLDAATDFFTLIRPRRITAPTRAHRMSSAGAASARATTALAAVSVACGLSASIVDAFSSVRAAASSNAREALERAAANASAAWRAPASARGSAAA